ncbi:hypothetical protein Cpir12675_003501 [Ceratocystis pirilliformis]|uniref:Glutamine synthetase n=1 Tax=Ceratocystis pirilliformis TaxID=259994 RepID=A0ABR3Z3J6_9PEZI
MSDSPDPLALTLSDLDHLLANDHKVKVAGIDADGMLRGKLMSKKKFLSVTKSGFGFCSVIFGWDMHDNTYQQELSISNLENGYRDLIAVIDPKSFRRIPWEDNVPLFLVSFLDPDTQKPICACPRSLLKGFTDKLAAKGFSALAGAEYEFYTFKAPGSDASPADFLKTNPPSALQSLTQGMFGYSMTRPVHNKDFYYDVFETCRKFRCDIEGWHTESGPGVFEAALEYGEIAEMADRANLFKFALKSTSTKYNIIPCFMAKPIQGLPGNSGHIHVSVIDQATGRNLFAREEPDPSPEYPDLEWLTDFGRHFLAGILQGLPYVMPMLAPTINSYKRLVENFWAPVTVSWGLEHRGASIRMIAPPTSKPSATRFEIRTCGADANAHLVMAAILGCGWRGVQKQLALPCSPLAKGDAVGSNADKGERLAKSLREATERFASKDSVAREVFGDDFVDHFAGTRMHEVRQWEEAVTDWEMRRYIETV